MTERTPNLVITRVYARTEVLRGFVESANLTLPAGRIVLGSGPPWDSDAGAGAWGSTGAVNTKLSIETPTAQIISKAYTERRKKRILTLGGVGHLVNPDQAVADFKHVTPG